MKNWKAWLNETGKTLAGIGLAILAWRLFILREFVAAYMAGMATMLAGIILSDALFSIQAIIKHKHKWQAR